MSSSDVPFVLSSEFWLPFGIIVVVLEVLFSIYIYCAYHGKEQDANVMLMIFCCCGCLPAIAYGMTTVRPGGSNAHRSAPQPQRMSRDTAVSQPVKVRLSVQRIDSGFVSHILEDSPSVVPVMSIRLLDEDGACLVATEKFGVHPGSKGVVMFDDDYVGTFVHVHAPCRVTIEIKLTVDTKSRKVNITERVSVAVDCQVEKLTTMLSQLIGMVYCKVKADDPVGDAPTKPKRVSPPKESPESSESTSSSASQSPSDEEYNSASDSASDREMQHVQRVKSTCFIERTELVLDHESNPRRATWKSLGIRVAITRMPSTSDAARIECQDRIAIICSQLTAHTNVERLFGFTELNKNTVAVITEYLGQDALESMLRDTSVNMSAAQQMNIAKACVSGLAHLHASGIMHGDVRSANVKISEDKDDVIRLANYWRTEDANDDGERRVKWLAPELQEHQYASLEGDIFALGGLLFEIYVRKEPFGDVSSSKAAARITRGKRAEIPTDVKVPSEVREMIADCWKQEQKERPTVTQLINRLDW